MTHIDYSNINIKFINKNIFTFKFFLNPDISERPILFVNYFCHICLFSYFPVTMTKKNKKKEKEIKYQAPALEKGLDILEYLSQKAMPMSQTEIASGIHKTPNEVYRMLVCLEQRGYLIRDEISAKYKTSLKLYHLSHRHSPVDELRRASQYPLDDLSKTTRQSCHLSVMYQGQLLVISQSRSPAPVALSIEEGSLFPLLKTTSGKILLAFMDDGARQEILKRDTIYTSFSLIKQKKFILALEEIKKTGYYITPSDLTKGVTDIALPIANDNSNAIASLTVSILSTQLNEEIIFEKIIIAMQGIVKEILKRLGLNKLK